ncbi:MAG: HPF/RaiA family ribosome-associated protein [Planctomycetota bacterium]
MQPTVVQVNFGTVQHSDALEQHIREKIASAMDRLLDRITRLEVHLHDDKHGGKDDHDLRATVEARIAGRQPLAVSAFGSEFYGVVNRAISKAGRAVAHQLEKQDSKR